MSPTETTKQNCLSNLRTLRFDLLGNENLVKQVDELSALVEKQDFEECAGESRRARQAVMDRISAVPVEVFEMNDGGSIKGVKFSFRSAEIVFFTDDGVRVVPFLQLPDEIRGTLDAAPIEYVVANMVEPLKKLVEEKSALVEKFLSKLEKCLAVCDEYREMNATLVKRLEDLGEL